MFLFLSCSGAGEFEDDGEGDGADGDESEVFGGEVEQDVQGGVITYKNKARPPNNVITLNIDICNSYIIDFLF